jgi:hypothetical protein
VPNFLALFVIFKHKITIKNIFNMKKTIFTGTINGQTFDNVADYNARMMQLLDKGVEIKASSSTSIKEVDTEPIDTFASTTEEGVSLFPFFEEDSKYYLDTLVTLDHERNLAIRQEIRNLLEKCYPYIVGTLTDNDIDIDTKRVYRDSIHELIAGIDNDRSNNLKCKAAIARRRDEAIAKYNAAKIEYNEAMVKFRNEEFMVDGANPVINLLLDFYRDIEAEAINAVKEHENQDKPVCNDTEYTCSGVDSNKSKPANDVECSVRETQPQTFKDVTDWFNQLLDECGIKLP